MEEDAFILKLAKTCLSDSQVEYLVDEWYLENYAIEPEVIGKDTVWAVFWEVCQSFIINFWDVRQTLEVFKKNQFQESSGNANRDLVFNFLGKVATDKDIYRKVTGSYIDRFMEVLDEQGKWIDKTLAKSK